MDVRRSTLDDDVRHDSGHESDVLLRQLDGHLAWVQARSPHDLPLAEHIARTLARLIAETARASAADRAKVRAAVHFVVVRRDGRQHNRHDRHPRRPVPADVPVLNEIVGQLGRQDLLIALA
jgi:hypothetical protein